MKKTMCFLMALALVLGLTQCKKEKPQTQGVRITLDVDGGNSKVDVNPTGGGTYATVTFQNGDIIYVGNNGSYCGYLQHDGTHFAGSINDASLSEGDYLHFYFMGNKGTTSQPSSVNITDQTSEYPVISYAHSTVKYTSGITHYSAKLQNYCAIVKFTTTDIDADITITGMKNTVTVDFAANNAATSTTGNPYSFSKDGDGNITLHRQSNTARWAILLPQGEVTTATATATGYASEGTFTVPEITANMYSNTGVSISMTAVWDGDLAHITSESTEAFATATDGMTITGTLGVNKKISIADGATVTLDNVSINYPSGPNYESGFAGITCLGDATIILKDGTTNNVAAMDYRYPGIQVGPTDKTLTIQGTGTLNAKFRKQGTYDISFGCGIGGGGDISCGNIVINDGTINAEAFNKAAGIGSGCCRTTSVSCGTITINGGTVTATGGAYAAGIGTGYAEGGNNSCGAISINGGTVTATGGLNAAGIGTGYSVSYKTNTCASITITDGVTQVTATKGSDAPNSIGAGNNGTCGTVTIGGVVTGNITDSPYTYPAPSLIVDPVVGQVIGDDGKNYATAAAATAAGHPAVAKIVYVGSDNGESAPYNHGLALALSDANGGSTCMWKTSTTDAGHTKQTSSTFTEESGLQYNDATHNSDTYPAFKAAIANNSTAAPTGCSAWFLASGYQWTKMINAAGGYATLRDGFSSVGGTNMEKIRYWTSSECTASLAWYVNFNSGDITNSNKNMNTRRVRACLAF